MHSPRPGSTLLLSVALLLAAAVGAPRASASPHRVKPAPVIESAAPVAPPRTAGTAPTCGTGVIGTPGSLLNFIFPPDDIYYTLLNVHDCATCALAETALVTKIHMTLRFRSTCPMPISIGVVGATGTPDCAVPDLASVIYSPEAFDLPIAAPNTTVDCTFTLSGPALIVDRAFLAISFLDTLAGCADTSSRPLLVLRSETCSNCRSYNDWCGEDDNPDELCAPAPGSDCSALGSPLMWAEVDSCYPLPDLIPPAPVTDLAVLSTTDSSAHLRWTAVGDDGNVGRPVRYLVAVWTAPIDASTFAGALHDSVTATVDAGGIETFDVHGLADGQTYYFAVEARDEAGDLGTISNVPSARTQLRGPLQGRLAPAIAPLERPSKLPVQLYWLGLGGTSRQTIRIYDLVGRLVRKLTLGSDVNGVATWNGLDDDGNDVPAGIYVARLDTGSRDAKARIVLLK